MIEIKHRITGKVLLRMAGRSLDRRTLQDVDLSGADLEAADLTGSRLERVGLRDASLRNAALVLGSWASVDARGADLSGALLIGSQFDGCCFTGAILSRADCAMAAFRSCSFEDTALHQVKVDQAGFQGCDGLGRAHGLHTISSSTPSTLDKGTPRNAHPNGFRPWFVFHASQDGSFAERLVTDLHANNVSGWQICCDLPGGEFRRTHMEAATTVGCSWLTELCNPL